jgi:hypothetical protein
MLRRVAVAGLLAIRLASTAHAQSTDPVAERGFAALQRGDVDAAAAVFRTALADRPRDAVLLYGAGYAAHLQGRDDEAARLLQEAVRIEPRLVQAAVLAGEIAYRRGDLDLAITTYERVLKQVPSNPAIRERLDTLKAEAGVEERFEAYKDDRFTVMFDGPAQQKLAAHATATMSASFMRTTAALGTVPSAPIRVVFYTTQQFHDITGAPEWAGGGFDGQIRLALAGATQDLGEFDRVLTHELTHAIIHAISPRNVPAWLHEGLALRFEIGTARKARTPATARVFVPLAALQQGFARLSTAQAVLAYDESAVAAAALVERIGPQGLGVLLRDLDGGQTIDQAVMRFGFTFQAFEADVARRLGVAPAAGRR